ncbi:MAG TPA: hypothetical protein VFJ24_04800 [Gaiellales bacterium]|nr:hypothetical protein [Gaiellales bacterium]
MASAPRRVVLLAAAEAEARMPRTLFIVSRETPYLVSYMRTQFSSEPDVEVLLDRRSGGDRRTSRSDRAPDRRTMDDRRQRRDVERQLRDAFHAVVTV